MLKKFLGEKLGILWKIGILKNSDLKRSVWDVNRSSTKT